MPGEPELIDRDGGTLAVAQTRDPGPHEGHSWEQPIRAGTELLATLRMRRMLSEGVEPEVLACTAPLLAGLLLARQTETEREHRHRSRVLEDLLEGHEDADLDTHRLLAKAGVRSDSDYVVLVAALAESAQRWGWLRATQIAAADGHGLIGTVSGSLVIVAPGDDAGATAQRWAEHLRSHDGLAATVGAVLGGRGGAPLRTAYREAASTLNLLLALGHTGR